MGLTPRPGEIFYLAKDKPYQIVTMGIHKETCESMVIYQALFGDFRTYVLPLSKFMKEVEDSKDHIIDNKPVSNSLTEDITDKDNTSNYTDIGNHGITIDEDDNKNTVIVNSDIEKSSFSIDKDHIGDSQNKEITVNENNTPEKGYNVLISFLDADSYGEKLEILTTNIKAIDDRILNNMAASIDCTIEEGPLDQRLQELIYCLQQMSRFEDRRLRK